MRILVHDFGAYPFTVQLSRQLAARGHDVRYLYHEEGDSIQGDVQMRADDPPTFSTVGIAEKTPGHRRSFARRLLHDFTYSGLLADEARAFEPDIVLSADCPLISQAALHRACKASGATFVFWLQDLIGVALQAVLGRKNAVLGRAASKPFRMLESKLLRESDEVLAISPAFVDYVENLGHVEGEVHLLPNWAPLASKTELETTGSWGSHLGLPNGPRVLYAGTLGLKHDPSLLADFAIHVKSTGGHVVVVSEGSGRNLLESLKTERRISNLYLLDYEPIERVPAMLASADVLVAILDEDASSFSVPSKVLSYLSVGRPVLTVMPAGNFAAQTVVRAKAGFATENSDPEHTLKRLGQLMSQAELRREMGANARAFAEQEFCIDHITDLVEQFCGIAPVVDVTTQSSPFTATPATSTIEQLRSAS